MMAQVDAAFDGVYRRRHHGKEAQVWVSVGHSPVVPIVNVIE